jgi:hypothetical protein
MTSDAFFLLNSYKTPDNLYQEIYTQEGGEIQGLARDANWLCDKEKKLWKLKKQ